MLKCYVNAAIFGALAMWASYDTGLPTGDAAIVMYLAIITGTLFGIASILSEKK
jgi:hypothetical protein